MSQQRGPGLLGIPQALSHLETTDTESLISSAAFLDRLFPIYKRHLVVSIRPK